MATKAATSEAKSAAPAASAGPTLPVSELDLLREKFLGLRVLADSELAHENEQAVKQSELPTVSKVACHLYAPFSQRHILYSKNKQNVITWIQYS